jgi:hypothetical protein
LKPFDHPADLLRQAAEDGLQSLQAPTRGQRDQPDDLVEFPRGILQGQTQANERMGEAPGITTGAARDTSPSRQRGYTVLALRASVPRYPRTQASLIHSADVRRWQTQS